MTFPTGWGRRCPLTIQASGIDSDLTDFPVLLTENSLPLEMFDADGSYPTLNGGGDIRFSSDSNGSTQLACEVVTFTTDNDPANGVAEIWVKVPSISSSMDTIIYIWYNKAGETQPTSSDTYGSESVWDSNFKIVQHMNEDPSSSAPQMIDSTNNDNDGTSNGSMMSGDLVDGKTGKALDFDGDDDYIECENNASLDITDTITVSAQFKQRSQEEHKGIVSKWGNTDDDRSWYLLTILDTEESYIRLKVQDSANTEYFAQDSSPISLNTWYQVVGVYNGSEIILYVDGIVVDSTGGISSLDSVSTNLIIGALSGVPITFEMNGIIDEVHISNIARSAAWIKAEFNNQYDPSTFVIEGTPEYVGYYYFSGYVFEQSNPVSRKLYLHNRLTGGLADTTTSSGDGYYYMETAFSGSHYIVCLDDAAGVDYNDLIIGPVFPTVVSG